MLVERKLLTGYEAEVPAVVLLPDKPIGGAVVTHGFGGCKEEQLGLAWRVAEAGLATYTIDFRGHGENSGSLDAGVLSDIEIALEACRQYGKTIAIGHSLGGRLALLSSANFAIGISPTLKTVYSESTKTILKNIRGYRVRESFSDSLWEILQQLPVWEPDKAKKAAIIYGSRDVPEIVHACNEVQAGETYISLIGEALHSDIFLHQQLFEITTDKIKAWFAGE